MNPFVSLVVFVKKFLSVPRLRFYAIMAGAWIIFLSACKSHAPETTQTGAPVDSSTQLILVTTRDWNSVPGMMQRFIRPGGTSSWTPFGAPIPIVVGRNGLGWGRGVNPPVDLPGPVKKEGDGKSPAGIFRLSLAFGLADADKMKPLKLPYLPLSAFIECVDDVKSVHYNSIVDRNAVPSVDWNSSEKMREVGAQYRLGVVVDQNPDPHVPGGGSCIFLHTWKDAKTGTSGCTAMTSENIDVIVPWLDPADKPLLVQLPENDYQLSKTAWHLPSIPE